MKTTPAVTYPLDARWRRLGALFSIEAATEPVDVEGLLVATWSRVRDDARLFVMALSWLALHGDLVDPRELGRRLRGLTPEDQAVAGCMLELASRAAGTHVRWARMLRRCRPLPTRQPLLRRMERFPGVVAALATQGHPVARRWGWLVSPEEVAVKEDAVAPRAWLVEHVPELRLRDVLGAGLDARILLAVADKPRSIWALSKDLGATYAGAHRAVEQLERRGLVAAPFEGDLRLVRPTAFSRRRLLADGDVAALGPR
jgi:hypothetical protein